MMDKRTHDENSGENKLAQPDPETLHTTDPQENMEGPVSNLIQETGEVFDSSEKSKEEADEKRDRRL